MANEQTKIGIKETIQGFANTNLSASALKLFQTIGYNTERQAPLTKKNKEEFKDTFISSDKRFDEIKARFAEWKYVDLLFQLSKEELTKQNSLFDTKQVDNTIIETYLFFAIELSKEQYSRTDLSLITREVNRLFPMPVMILFKHGSTLTLSVINRRLHKRDESKDVLEKVTQIKDINIASPHRAHIEILFDLSFDELMKNHPFTNFVELHNAWQKTLDLKELNNRFFRELANWYFWATSKVIFPDDEIEDKEIRNATGVIRLITRLMFVWFLKEKNLVPEDLFDEKKLKHLLKYTDENKSTYYKAILQNLFFATLNTEMGKRKFRSASDKSHSSHYFIHNLFRYENEFFKPKETLEKYFDPIPFLNGGLFECLDKQIEIGDGLKAIRIDGFSDRTDNALKVPDELFFCENEKDIDLNATYGTRNKRYKVRGLIDILNSYKFTIAENTPIEEEVALDPELLGKVFENLLANYNPETQTTARKQTGSFYTPREIVNYMVDECLIAYLKNCLNHGLDGLNDSADSNNGKSKISEIHKSVSIGDSDNEQKLRNLLSYTENEMQFSNSEREKLIHAIDNIKILDPACGSGAFPMGILHKLVHILHKLDPKNEQWEKLQLDKVDKLIQEAENIPDTRTRENVIADLEKNKRQIEQDFANNELDFGRKLFLIENCIYGVDIQPIAVQIAKLRFFISLIVDQKVSPASSGRENLGIRPLPNLETKFVAANTLIALEKEKEDLFSNEELKQKKEKLKLVRHKYFEARTPKTKQKCRDDDKRLRGEMARIIKDELIHFNQSIAQQIQQEERLVEMMKKELNKPNLRAEQKARLEKDLKKKAGKIAELKLHITDNNVIEQTAHNLSSWDPYDQNGSANFFDTEWMFGLKEGFDVVIGNPPWGAKLSEEEKKYLTVKFPFVPSKIKDSYLYFLSKSLEILSPNALLSLIIPNTWLLINNADDFRKYILCYKIIEIDDYGDGIFEQATVESSTLIVTNTKDKIHPVKVKRFKKLELISENIIEKKMWAEDSLSRILLDINSDNSKIIKLAEKNTEQFSVNNHIIWGIKPYQVGYGKPPQTVSDVKARIYHSSHSRGKDWQLLLVGSSVNRYTIKYGDLEYIKYGKWLMYPSNIEVMKSEKILLRQTSDILRAAFDDSKYLAQNSLFLIHSNKYNLKYLTALLNSPLLNFIYKIKNPQNGKVFAEVKPSVVKELPIFKADKITQSLFSVVVDFIMEAKKKNKDSSFFERLIDAMVYELYLPEAIQNAKCEVLKHLTNLPELKEGEEEETAKKNLKTIEKVYKELSDPKHPVSVAMQKMQEVEEVKIIEGKK